MGQITAETIAMIRRAVDAGQAPPLTLWEYTQLAWLAERQIDASPSPDGKAEQAEAPSVLKEQLRKANQQFVDVSVALMKYVPESEAAAKSALQQLGDAHGYGWCQSALGKMWDVKHGCAPRGSMGVTVKDCATQPTASNAGERGDPAETADDSDRLKPCPFCGSEAEGCTMPAEQEDVGVGAMFVQCTNSRCMASSALIYPLMDDPKPLLLERWNRRAALASKPPQGEQVDAETIADVNYQRGEEIGYRMGMAAARRAQPEQVAQDSLQGAADWLFSALNKCDEGDLQRSLLIGYNRAERLLRAARARGEGKS